jgi:tripeptide aminopeptidase
MINSQRLVEEFIELVKIDSPGKKEKAFAGILKDKLVKLGLKIEFDQVGSIIGGDTGNLIARLSGKAGVPTLLFSAHMDTVSPSQNIKPIVKDNIIYGDGNTILGGDDKAGIVIILEVIRFIQENKIDHGDIVLAFTVAEEIGLLGSRYLDYALLKADMAFVLDSGGDPGTIISQASSRNSINAILYGRAAHAGVNPEKGINAIQIAARAIGRMKLLRIDRETTANMGIIQGGTATNIVCDKVEIQGEARSLNEEKLELQTKHMIDCLKEAAREFGGKVEISTERSYPAFIIPEDDAIIKLAERAALKVGLTVKTVKSGGGSDANYFNSQGLKAVNMSIGMSKMHTKEEYIKIKDMVNMAGYVAAIIMEASQ